MDSVHRRLRQLRAESRQSEPRQTRQMGRPIVRGNVSRFDECGRGSFVFDKRAKTSAVGNSGKWFGSVAERGIYLLFTHKSVCRGFQSQRIVSSRSAELLESRLPQCRLSG